MSYYLNLPIAKNFVSVITYLQKVGQIGGQSRLFLKLLQCLTGITNKNTLFRPHPAKDYRVVGRSENLGVPVVIRWA